MTNLIIFDLDGVLIDSKDIHFCALNRALEQIEPIYVINKEDHLKIFDGLPTFEKLEILSRKRNLPISSHQEIFDRKQQNTFEEFSKFEEDLFLYCT